jgi:hypothetical protein
MTSASWASAVKFCLIISLIAMGAYAFYAAWGVIEWQVISRMKNGHHLQLIPVALFTGIPICSLVFFTLILPLDYNSRKMFLDLPGPRAVGLHYRSSRRRLRKLYLNLRYGRSSSDGIYHALDTKVQEIRIVNIGPGSGTEPIECELQHLQLGDLASTYEALSYTWGPVYDLCSIKLHGNHFHVTKNLEAALRQLRLPNAVRRVWIDALCIDQSNFAQRGQQVLLMRQIYSNATEVLVWLGESTRTSDYAMDFLSQGSRQESAKQWFKSTITDSLSLYEREWYAALLTFRREYWKRVWIIQEVALAAKLRIICGSRTVSWGVAVDCESAWREIEQRGGPQYRDQMADVAGIFTWIRKADLLKVLGNHSMTYDDLNNLERIRLSLLDRRPSSKLLVCKTPRVSASLHGRICVSSDSNVSRGMIHYYTARILFSIKLS